MKLMIGADHRAFDDTGPEECGLQSRGYINAFLRRVGKPFERDPQIDLQAAVSAVFWLLDRHVSPGEVDDVRNSLPSGLRDIWIH